MSTKRALLLIRFIRSYVMKGYKRCILISVVVEKFVIVISTGKRKVDSTYVVDQLPSSDYILILLIDTNYTTG